MTESFLPRDMVEGALLGAAGPVPCTITNALIDHFDYIKKSPGAGEEAVRTTAAIITYQPHGENQAAVVQMYSIGAPDSHKPSADKKGFEGPFNKGSNFAHFMLSAINAGFPEEKLQTRDISVFIGWDCEVKQVAPATRAGLEKGNKPVPVPVKSLKLPWDKPAGGATEQATAPADDETVAVAEQLILAVVEKNGEGGAYAFTDLKTLGAKSVSSYLRLQSSNKVKFPPAARTKVVKLCQDVEFLGSDDRPWAFDAEGNSIVVG